MKHVLKITRAENGYILLSQWDTEEGSEEIVTVHEGEDEEGIEKLLLAVAEWAGVLEDPYSNANLRISFDRAGRKYEIPSELLI